MQVGEEGFCGSPAPVGAALAGGGAAEETGVAASRVLELSNDTVSSFVRYTGQR